MMNTLWKITKASLLISLLLLAGQVPLGKRTVGGHLVHSIYEAVVWVGTTMKESEWFAKMSDSEKTTQASPPPAVEKKKSIEQAAPVEKSPIEKAHSARVAIAPSAMLGPVREFRNEGETITTSDRDSLLQLLEE